MLSRKQIHAILATIVLCSLATSDVQSQAASPRYGNRWEISLGGGFFLPARVGFREYYKGGPEAEIAASYEIRPRLSARVDFFFTRLPEQEVLGDLEFRMYSIVPSIKLTLPKVHEPYFGVGLGYYRGTVIYHGAYYPRGGGEQQISNGGVGFKFYGGLKYYVIGGLFVAGEGRYCHTLLGDPYKGDFGNVGGFSAMGRLGISF